MRPVHTDPGMEKLLSDIEEETRFTAPYTGIEAISPFVMDAIARVPRAKFVPAGMRPFACMDAPLPIGEGQTISQPFIVALMTDLLAPSPGLNVLEIGTGSGYQAAILALLFDEVFTIEVIPALARQAEERLRRLGYDNVRAKCGDGSRGWPDKAPFDRIILTAAAAEVPKALFAQLKPGGRLVAPVGEWGMPQVLMLYLKDQAGKVKGRMVLDVAFVPLVEGDRGKNTD